MRFIWHKDPDEAIREKCRYLEKVRKTDGASAYWALTRELLKTDPWFLMRVALEWGWLDDKLVGSNFIKHIATHWGEDIGILFPRGHGKTLPMSAMCISAICQNPDIAILEISRTEGNADKIGLFISELLVGNDFLQQCFGRKYNKKDGFLPSSVTECSLWGKEGYTLPYRKKPRIDPTLLCIPLKGAKAGKHPDIVWLDDPTEEENNNERGWEQVAKCVQGCWFLLPPEGFFLWTGTRWDDKDPLGRAVEGKLEGKHGKFHFIQYSCYEDDDPTKPPVYPLKVRWNMDKASGYTHEMLEAKRKPVDEGGFGEFFDAQMRNDPAPADRAVIRLADIQRYTPEQLPKLGPVRYMGVETSGGGLVIYQGLQEKVEALKLNIPLVPMENPRKAGVEKSDRIVAAIQPIVSQGRLYLQEWMLGEDGAKKESLGYELKRIHKAAHDDIADALHNAILHLIQKTLPSLPTELLHTYISVDTAYTEKARSDWTVAITVAVDSRGNHWVIDYDRFQSSTPSVIHERLISYYQKHETPQSLRAMSNRRYPGSWR